jgi:alpha-D-xyloside xylohydrolase
MDASEPEFDILKGRQTFLGSGESVRNAYPLYVTKAIYQGQRATTDRKRVVIFTRSAFAGQQRYAAISWSGDISANWLTFQRTNRGWPELRYVGLTLLDDGCWRVLSA